MYDNGQIRRLGDDWTRMAYFRHFYDDAPCAISLCDSIDVTALTAACRETEQSFYLAILYVVTEVVNAHEAFRMTTVDAPDLPYPMPAVWEAVHPVHNVFHPDTQTYTALWTLWDADFATFTARAAADMERARRLYVPSIPCGGNTFEASCIPWRSFTAVGVQSEAIPLSPIIVWGRARETDGRVFMPLSIQIHHAAADGYHLARFIEETEEKTASLADRLR